MHRQFMQRQVIVSCFLGSWLFQAEILLGVGLCSLPEGADGRSEQSCCPSAITKLIQGLSRGKDKERTQPLQGHAENKPQRQGLGPELPNDYPVLLLLNTQTAILHNLASSLGLPNVPSIEDFHFQKSWFSKSPSQQRWWRLQGQGLSYSTQKFLFAIFRAAELLT